MTQLTTEYLLRWHIEAGVDETIGETPLNRYDRPAPPAAEVFFKTVPAEKDARRSEAPRPITRTNAQPDERRGPASPPAALSASSAEIAASARTLDELRDALERWDGCALKKTCRQTVFADGDPQSGLMIIGEAPGADEDRVGRPFVGASGQLLDRMLRSIGLDRTGCYIANLSPWRPPGNRKPEQAETELLLPILRRHIQLANPRCLLLLGGAPANALLGGNDAISRIRGAWREAIIDPDGRKTPVLASFHPAFLLRTPAHKRLAWMDFLNLRLKMEQEGWGRFLSKGLVSGAEGD